MEFKINQDVVIYVQCPECRRGWYAHILSVDIEPFMNCEDIENYIDGPLGSYYIKSYVVQGWDKMDLTEPTKCLHCGHEYTPLSATGIPATEHMCLMEEWVAERLLNCKGG